ncbi:hypothetical protein MKZ38_004924 [Zalerion maritima]|uniref:Uncharacterized protein n=1 Tax=Zalerion maritima TaxID=339359 RepID=A0AAD5S469_9PEZI|nr:hypothetical protein MKZ38_004924 [Zalerion maritima]
MAPAATSNYFPLASETATDADPFAGGEDAGAAGDSSGANGISHGGLIAIIVVVVVVGVLGISMSVLFYLTKKHEWRLREKMRRSARKVVTALTPRRSEFPRHLKEGGSGGKSSRARMRLDDVPPTPRLRPEDIEKLGGSTKVGAFSRDSSSDSKRNLKKPRWPGHR